MVSICSNKVPWVITVCLYWYPLSLKGRAYLGKGGY